MKLQEAIKKCKKFVKAFKKDDTKSVIVFDVQAIETVLKELEAITEEKDIYKDEYDKITKALNFKEGSLNPPVEVCIERLKKAIKNSIPKKKIEDKIKELDNKPIKIYTSNKKHYYETDKYNGIIKQILKELLEE